MTAIMDIGNKIPFGLCEEKNTLVDVVDVPQGKDCHCICPSCRLALIARHGNINRWHFAHAGRKNKSIDNECEYSFFVSVRAMAKQIMTSGFTLFTPGHIGKITQKGYPEGSVFSEIFFETYRIAREGVITLSHVKKECSFESSIVDIMGEFNGYSIVIYFSHKHREVPPALYSPVNHKCGIIEINLDATSGLFTAKGSQHKRFVDELECFLKENLRSKKWIFHPRQISARMNAEKNLTDDIENNAAHHVDVYKEGMPAMSGRIQRCECLSCNKRWAAVISELHPRIDCPDCKTHLYVRYV